jgi:biotin synthase
MSEFIHQAVRSVLAGEAIDRETALRLASDPGLEELWQGANRVREHFHGSRFSLCSIINARSGRCSEDCRFCAQSARHSTLIEEYDIIDRENAMAMAADNDRHGVHRLSLVTSGRSADEPLLARLADLYARIGRATGIRLCGSLGILTRAKAVRLREMGVTRYHCNLEVSRGYFPRICSTHSWEDKVETLRLAREAGMSVCSGGIIGTGESMADRIDMAFELRELGVDSIPLNIMTPIPGTPLAEVQIPGLEEILTVIALFRFINPEVTIRIAGGRQQLGDQHALCFSSGANGAMVGNYLTTAGTSIEEDLATFRSMGFTLT